MSALKKVPWPICNVSAERSRDSQRIHHFTGLIPSADDQVHANERQTTINEVKRLLLLISLITLCCGAAAAIAIEPCRIEVHEKGSGWPIPLVELRTVHEVRFVTDNAGIIAFDLPEAMCLRDSSTTKFAPVRLERISTRPVRFWPSEIFSSGMTVRALALRRLRSGGSAGPDA